MDVTLTGATGFIGTRLVKALVARGDRVTILSRSPRDGTNPRYATWDSRTPPRVEADAVVHLAGEPVAQRWTPAAKDRILASRVEGTRALVAGLAAADSRPAVLVSASAIGIYGNRGDELLTESSRRGEGFLADVTAAWEAEAAKVPGMRVVLPRIGIVLGTGGGALAKMLPAFRMGGGGRLGPGTQWMSWIHVDDLVGIILHALGDERVSGPVNATAPNPVRNTEFTRELGAALHRPVFAAVPALALKVMFGEMSSVLLDSQKVFPQVITAAGYRYRYEQLGPAFADLLVY